VTSVPNLLSAQDPEDSFLLLGGKGLSAVHRCDVADQASPEYTLGLAGHCSSIFDPRLITCKTHDAGRVDDHSLIAAAAIRVAFGFEKTPEDHDTRLSLAARLQRPLGAFCVVVHL